MDKEQQFLLGILGIVAIVAIFGMGFFVINSNYNALVTTSSTFPTNLVGQGFSHSCSCDDHTRCTVSFDFGDGEDPLEFTQDWSVRQLDYFDCDW